MKVKFKYRRISKKDFFIKIYFILKKDSNFITNKSISCILKKIMKLMNNKKTASFAFIKYKQLN